MIGNIAPAVPNIDTGKFHPRQQRNGTDLILGIVFGQPPDMRVIGPAHIVTATL